ncbi:CocE/NonD family hydrolase [Pseudomaricurvus sp. HS19]|uniref:CocE/NonD family hydrolase n=1 Tax=Pseudomaricurvus sp. HS19 TaxID=2692626 RepID=UPI001371E7ED|nr:CocE/NonD family hydrolase [Pseudomaricurvus sp. HS19]MYM63363.1 CocE/NonD family hydrolase [Pseudomaricurvus sp. HS19]
MSANPLLRWLAGKLLRLPPRRTGNIQLEAGIRVVMRDGVELLTDHYWSGDQPRGPLVLIRSSYGRGGMFGLMAALMAERGLQVIAQSVRGTAGSGGQLDPMRQERDDGADTLDWIRCQPWYSGQIYTFGPSYLGNTQWAMAAGSGEKLQGMLLMMTLSNFGDELRAGGGYTLEGTLGWTQLMQQLVGSQALNSMQRPQPERLKPFHNQLPLAQLDQQAFGKTVPWWQQWLRHEPDDAWWQAMNYSAAATSLEAPVNMIAGWQDAFLPYQLQDFSNRQQAGKPVWITIGPWYHSSPAGMVRGLQEAIGFFGDLGNGRAPCADRQPVRLYLQQAKRWLEFPCWPPPQAQPLQLYLRQGQALSHSAAALDEGSVSYTYDPADPTPSMHGPTPMGHSRVRDMSALEARDDSVSFTGSILGHDLDIIGPVSVELTVHSDREHTDFFVCLCDVDRRGRPIQVSDGYLRLRPGSPVADADGKRHIRIDCWPTAWRFKAGHRLRLIVTSGAHPRYARNPGSGEPLGSATRLLPAHQQLLLSATQPCRLLLSEVTLR